MRCGHHDGEDPYNRPGETTEPSPVSTKMGYPCGARFSAPTPGDSTVRSKASVEAHQPRRTRMLSKEENELITRTGPATPMGNAMRRYWVPACLSSEIGEPDGAPVRVKLMGEELVAFRETHEHIPLVARTC